MIRFSTWLRSPKAETWVFALILSLAALRFLHGYADVYGVDSFDESLSLWLAKKAWFRIPWSPLYLVYYHGMLRAFGGDALAAYYFNIGLLSVLFPLTFFLVLRRLSVGPLISFISAYYLLIASFNAPLIPKGAHFSLIMVFAGLFLLSFLRDQLSRLIFLVAVLGAAVFIRQDMFLLFLAATGYLVYFSWNYRVIWTLRHKLALLTVSGGGFFFVSAFGNMLSRSRSWQVFSECFRYNADFVAPALGWPTVAEAFGNVDSVTGAFIRNPSAVWLHMAVNFERFAMGAVASLSQHFPLTSKYFQPAAKVESAIAWTAFAAFLAAGLILRRFRKDRRRPQGNSFQNLVIWVCVGLILKSLLVVGIFWGGTPRYYLDAILACLLLLAVLSDKLAPVKAPPFLALAVALGLLILVPTHKDCVSCGEMSPIKPAYSAKEWISYLNKMAAPGQSCFYTGNFDVFLSPKLRCIQSGDRLSGTYPSQLSRQGELASLKAYLHAKGFDYVLVSRFMRIQMKEYGREGELDAFLQQYKDWGYREKYELRPGEFVISR